MADHAVFSASGAQKWMSCPGSLFMEKDIPNQTSSFAEEGTVFHEIVARALSKGHDPAQYLGATVNLINGKAFDISGAKNKSYNGNIFELDPKYPVVSDHSYAVDREMVDYAHQSVLTVLKYLPPGCPRYIEQRVDFSNVIGVPDSFGTLDVGGFNRRRIVIFDHKFGMGVKVYAERNVQLLLYALGFYDLYGRHLDFNEVELVINQPRIGHIDSWVCSVEDLLQFGREAKAAAAEAMRFLTPQPATGGFEVSQRLQEALVPGEKQCRFCRARGTCPALAKKNFDLIADDFVNLDDPQEVEGAIRGAIAELPDAGHNRLAVLMANADLLEIFLKGVREACYTAAISGRPVPGTKLVQGKQGNRKWKSEEAAVAAMKGFKIKASDIYEQSLISVAQAEKRFAKRPKQWEKMQEHISRSAGKLSVALASDERAEVKPQDLSGDFENLTANAEEYI